MLKCRLKGGSLTSSLFHLIVSSMGGRVERGKFHLIVSSMGGRVERRKLHPVNCVAGSYGEIELRQTRCRIGP